MSIQTPSTDQHHIDEAVPGPRGPVARIIAACLAAGVATTAVLTLVVFPGASESTITGSILVAFGFGWALMGLLTTRFTSHPQRWTAVPAAAMGAAGLGLLAFAPQSSAMTAMSWIWPAPMLALAIYIRVQARRSTPRRARWMLTAVVAVLAIAAVGATYEDVSVVRGQHSYAAPGKSYAVGGHRLYLDCRGQGGPTVILFNGLGEVSASWARITDQVDPTTRVCSYDRAGQGWSGDVTHAQDAMTAGRDLHTLLSVAGEHGPFLLVGHSTGGTYAMTYAAHYPHQVAGMVLLDSASPDQFTVLPSYAGEYAVMRRGLAILPTLDRLGLGRAFAAAIPSHLPQPAADVVTSLTAGAHGARNGRDEVSMLPQVFAEAQALTSLNGRPLAVLTATESLDKTAGWAEAQDRLVALSSNRLHRVVDSSHAGLLEDQSPANQAGRAIEDVVSAIRTGARLQSR